ncbi:hypothetical protein V6Z94_006408 [Aspergillus fumigatus]
MIDLILSSHHLSTIINIPLPSKPAPVKSVYITSTRPLLQPPFQDSLPSGLFAKPYKVEIHNASNPLVGIPPLTPPSSSHRVSIPTVALGWSMSL